MSTLLALQAAAYWTRSPDKGPHVFKNAPLALQIATLPYQEEMCLGISEIIDHVLHPDGSVDV